MKAIRKITGLLLVLGVATTTLGSQVASGTPDQLQVGDRIAIAVEGPAAFIDTVLVRDGGVIQIKDIGEISVQGVRRADVQTFLSREIAKYVKDPVVHATALVRIAVIGAVARPGYYMVPSDYVLSDVLMQAGGPVSNADINRTVIQRNGKDVIGKKTMTQALAAGSTLNELQIASGDQIVVAEKPRGGMDNLLRVGGVVAGIAGVAVALRGL